MASSRWAAWFSAATCSSHSCRRIVTISASLSTAAYRCTTRVGIIATYSAISRASRRSFSRREQGTDDSALVTTARLKANRGDCERAHPYDQLGPAGCVVTYRKEPPLRQHHHVQAVLRHVDTAKREHGHLRIPSLLMRARALATVRVWKKRPEHQAHSRSDIRDACGLPVATGAQL